jgi:hypothetical protein
MRHSLRVLLIAHDIQSIIIEGEGKGSRDFGHGGSQRTGYLSRYLGQMFDMRLRDD